jgi:hypothetical protein
VTEPVRTELNVPVLGTVSQTSASGGQLGGCSGVDMLGGVEVCLEEPQGFPCLMQCSRLVSEQGVQSAVSQQSVNKVPSVSKEKK